MMKPLPSLSQAYSLLLQEEVQQDCTISRPNAENTAMNVRFHGNKTKPYGVNSTPSQKENISFDVSHVQCDYCNATGHTRDKCLCLNGYPEWHRLFGKPKPKPWTANFSTYKKAPQVSTHINASPPTAEVSSVLHSQMPSVNKLPR